MRNAVRLAQQIKVIRQGQPGGFGAIGDSITRGQSRGRFHARDSWVSHVIAAGVPFTINAGVPNQTTEQIAARLPDVLAAEPRTVVILAGTNDVWNDWPLSAGLRVIEGMADACRGAGVRPVIATLPPFLGRDVEPWNRLVRALPVPVIDFYVAVAGIDWSRDGIHPNETGARAMAAAAAPVIRQAILGPLPESAYSP